MKEVGYYRGREQTYLKHFFLERYLERVAYVIGWNYPQFVYVDGFSGPWKSEDEAFEDTSFIIAINKLRQVQTGLMKAGKRPNIRCLFIEKEPTAFHELKRATSSVSDITVEALHGEFEQQIPDILRFVGSSFSLVFIDPAGWTGFGLRRIAPILQHQPGEVLINFMFDHINRFLLDSRSEIAASFEELFGGPGWESAVQHDQCREDAVVKLYRERMRATGGFRHITSTRILKPMANRSYFYLIYGTRHLKGLQEFRRVEKVAIDEQERVRSEAKQIHRVERSAKRNSLLARLSPMRCRLSRKAPCSGMKPWVTSASSCVPSSGCNIQRPLVFSSKFPLFGKRCPRNHHRHAHGQRD